MDYQGTSLLLADDDLDDCSFFQDALAELSIKRELEIVHNGEELMLYLHGHYDMLPAIIFMDLNMPGRNGFECLSEIKKNEMLRNIPVVIISTSSQQEVIHSLYKLGAHCYIRKPNEFSRLKESIFRAINHVDRSIPPSISNFTILP